MNMVWFMGLDKRFITKDVASFSFRFLTKSKIWFVFDENWAFGDPVTMQYEMGTLICHDSLAILPSIFLNKSWCSNGDESLIFTHKPHHFHCTKMPLWKCKFLFCIVLIWGKSHFIFNIDESNPWTSGCFQCFLTLGQSRPTAGKA